MADPAVKLTKAQLMDGLEPFALEAYEYDFGDGSGPDLVGQPDTMEIRSEGSCLMVGDLRRARALLDALKEEGETGHGA